MPDDYPLEVIRQFLIGRQWFVGEDETYLVNRAEFASLKKREDVRLGAEREKYILAFADGWRAAKGRR